MARGDGRTAPTNIDAWRQRLAEAEEENDRLAQENEELRGRLEDIGAIAAPDAQEEIRSVREKQIAMDAKLDLLLSLHGQETGKLIEMPKGGEPA